MSTDDVNPPLTELVAARDVLERRMARLHRKIRGDGKGDDASLIADLNMLDTRYQSIEAELLRRAIATGNYYEMCPHGVVLGRDCGACVAANVPGGTK